MNLRSNEYAPELRRNLYCLSSGALRHISFEGRKNRALKKRTSFCADVQSAKRRRKTNVSFFVCLAALWSRKRFSKRGDPLWYNGVTKGKHGTKERPETLFKTWRSNVIQWSHKRKVRH
jgi:hypothetical protein